MNIEVYEQFLLMSVKEEENIPNDKTKIPFIPFSKPGNTKFGKEIILIAENTKFYVPKDVLCQMSEYFDILLLGHFCEREKNEIEMKDENAEDMRTFLEATVPHPDLLRIEDSNLRTLMRLSDKFQTPSLKCRCSEYIQRIRDRLRPKASFTLLTFVYSFNFDNSVAFCLLPAVACLSLDKLEKFKERIGLELYSRIIALKLKATYIRAQETYASSSHFCFDFDSEPSLFGFGVGKVLGCLRKVKGVSFGSLKEKSEDKNSCNECGLKLRYKCSNECKPFLLNPLECECDCTATRKMYEKLLSDQN